MTATVMVLAGAGRYIHWGVVQLSLTNLLIIVGMIVVFVLALIVPFPGGNENQRTERDDEQL